MASPKDEELITTPQLCEWLKISKATASNWRKQGLPYVGKERSLRYKRSEVLKWLKEQEAKTK